MDVPGLIQRIVAYADLHHATAESMSCSVQGLTLVRQRTPTSFAPMVYQPLLCVVLRGAKQSTFGTRTITFSAMQSLIVSMDLPSQSRVIEASTNQPDVALALEVNISELRELAAATDMQSDDIGQAVAVGPSQEAVVDAMRRLFDLVDKPVEALILAPLIIREIHYLLLTAGHGGMLRHLLNQDGHACRIARSVAAIRRDYAAPLRVSDLARVAGMSLSGFHDHFKAVTATTPVQFQKQLRLIEARQLLLDGERSVTSAALDVGYKSPTQFSRDYVRAFGVPPGRDRQSRR